MTINSDNSLGMKILEMLDKSVYMDVITGKLQSISPALTRIDLAKWIDAEIKQTSLEARVLKPKV